MSVAEKWATVALVIYGLALVWDLIDPRAMKINWNNGGRALLSFLSAIATITTLLLVIGATAATVVIVVLALLLVSVIAAAL